MAMSRARLASHNTSATFVSTDSERASVDAPRLAVAAGRSLTPLLFSELVRDTELAITILRALVWAFTKSRAGKLEIVNFATDCAA